MFIPPAHIRCPVMSTQSPTTSFTPFNGDGGQARSFQERRDVSHAMQNENTMTALQYFRITLRIVGAFASFLFLIQEGVFVFLGEDFNHPSFKTFCRWISQALLGILIGSAGMYLEIRGSMTSVASNLMKHAMNRFAVAIFYFWMGCYIIAKELTGWQVAFQFSAGVMAWFVSIGDLIVVCAPSERRDEDVECAVPAGGSSQSRTTNELAPNLASRQSPFLAPSVGFPEAQQWSTSAAGPATTAATSDNPFGAEDPDSSGVTAHLRQSPSEPEAGVGQWNSAAFGKSFGSA